LELERTGTSTERESWSTHALNVLRGMAMGSADIVPGVSGGTIALLLGIYETLLGSIRSLTDRAFLEAVFQRRLRDALEMVPWRFLLALGGGILLAALTLARVLSWLLENQPVLLWSFFAGLVLASVFVVTGRVPAWSVPRLLQFAIGAVGAYLLVGMVPAQTPETPLFLFLSGALAICAMILPGISGAFILVLLGKYQYVLDAVNNMDVVTIAIVGVGAVAGLVSVARLLSWLGGLMLGSLRKLWPWKNPIAWVRDAGGDIVLDSHGEPIVAVEANFLPDIAVPGGATEVLFALLLAFTGFAIVMAINRRAASAAISEPAA
jgi:putative membrane protein